MYLYFCRPDRTILGRLKKIKKNLVKAKIFFYGVVISVIRCDFCPFIFQNFCGIPYIGLISPKVYNFCKVFKILSFFNFEHSSCLRAAFFYT